MSGFEDVEGKQWFDTLSGMWLKNIGHGRKEIADAVYEQMLDISYSPGGSVTPATVRLAAKVSSISPDKESRVYFVSGGSEAVETALKMAKNYHKNNGESARWKVISRTGSYHGATMACMSLGGGGISAPVNFGPLMPGNIHVAQPNEYRCAYCRDRGGCNLECARDVDRAIEHEGASTVAAFIGEPISAASGIHVPHQEYWSTIREICDKHGVVMICDEVITGFGRTGKMFGTENWGIKPDIITVAKALTSGYMPIGAAIASRKIAEAFSGDDEDSTFRHLFTFGGNPPACAAGPRQLEDHRGGGAGRELGQHGRVHVRAASDPVRAPHRRRRSRRHGYDLRRGAGQGPRHQREVSQRGGAGEEADAHIRPPRAPRKVGRHHLPRPAVEHHQGRGGPAGSARWTGPSARWSRCCSRAAARLHESS